MDQPVAGSATLATARITGELSAQAGNDALQVSGNLGYRP